ncbi:IucA/IucC family protein [Plantibacter sp. RU18]|uniref:IucA/IucC family protein n=1 Tax=Plantibacter sp. RU18 TaxID=3158143 RepID=UPI003D361A44
MPSSGEPDRWSLEVGGSVYHYSAQLYDLEHWVIDEPSILRMVAGRPAPLDAQNLILELHQELAIPAPLVGTYLEELASTLGSAAAKHRRQGPSSDQIAKGRSNLDIVAGFQDAEATMTEGHPAFIASNGRMGFGLREYREYAPEFGRAFRYRWLAARREEAHLALSSGRSDDEHWADELGPEALGRFHDCLRRLRLDPADFIWIPVHPWQWQHRIAISFAPDLGRRSLVDLGEMSDQYQPQQSIRTGFNRSSPRRSYVKTALSIQNMGFLRGLSPAYMKDTPRINDWVQDLVDGDTTLQECRFSILIEHASIGYTGDAYHQASAPSSQQKMLAALWRQSPIGRLDDGERPMTMAVLLHRDSAGVSVVSALVRRSGLEPSEWVRRYLHAYLRPLVYCLVVHNLAFMPHSENVILVLRDCAVRRVFMKDIGEEIAVLASHPGLRVPVDIERIVIPVDDDEASLAIFTDIFDGVFRFLAGILDQDGTLAARRFWQLVGECVDRVTAENPNRARSLDLRQPDFDHSCLNRLQLRNTREMVDLADPSSSLIRTGKMKNPIARQDAHPTPPNRGHSG